MEDYPQNMLNNLILNAIGWILNVIAMRLEYDYCLSFILTII